MSRNYTTTETWTVEDLYNAITNPDKKKRIVIPKFQRTLVWKNDQKKIFIDSIKKGFPIGSILLYKEGSLDDKKNTIYGLIDGLQRSTTIKKYIDKPTDFFDNTNLSDEVIGIIFSFLNSKGKNIDKEVLIEKIVEWILKIEGFEESKGFSSHNIAYYLDEVLALEFTKDEIKEFTSLFIDPLKVIKLESDILKFSLPILIFTGEKDKLPVIFERLNSKGTQLNKYQIYAATWSHYGSISISNIDILKSIKEKYDSLIVEGYEVENYDSNLRNFIKSEFSYFEYLFGFGKYISDKYNFLFKGSTSPEQEESIGFNIFNICLGLPFNEMDILPKKLIGKDLIEIENLFLDSIKVSNDFLKGILSLKMNSNGRIPINHTEYQITSIVGKIFHSKYDSSFKEKSDWSTKKKLLNNSIKYHYLFDILKEDWKGSGDSKAFNLISSDKYEKQISMKSWESLLDDWLSNELEKKEKVRVNLKDSSILFLKYIYTFILSAHEELSSVTFDIEHLVPVDRLKTIAGEKGLPISAFTNLCLLDSELNRKKGSLTFYEYYDKQVKDGNLTKIQADSEIEKIEKYTFTTRTDLEFISNPADFNEENYLKFLNSRYMILKEKFFTLNNIK